MRKCFCICCVCISFASAGVGQAPDLSKMDVVERSVPAGPVALVDKTAIEGADFLREYRRHLKNVMHLVETPDASEEFRVHAGLTILGEMIRERILLDEAKRRKLSVSEKDVDKAYTEKLSHFEKMLEEETGQKPTEAQVLEKAGQTREEARASLREQLLVQAVMDAIVKEKKATVAATDLRTYYDNNKQYFERPGGMHLNQILIIPKPNAARADDAAWKQAEEKAKRARARVLAGEQFAAVARDMSEAPDASKGGDMGMLPVNQLPPFFVERAKSMKNGDVSEPFRSEFGMHVVKMMETEVAETVSFEDAKPHIEKMLKAVKTEEAVLEFCEPIVNDASRTQIFIQLERTLAALGGTEKPKK